MFSIHVTRVSRGPLLVTLSNERNPTVYFLFQIFRFPSPLTYTTNFLGSELCRITISGTVHADVRSDLILNQVIVINKQI